MPIAPVPRARRGRRADDGIQHPGQLNVEEPVEVVHMHEKRVPQVKYRGWDDLGGSGSLLALLAVELMHVPDHPQPQRARAENPHGQPGQRSQGNACRCDVKRCARVHLT